MKRLGIIGGMGPAATSLLFSRVIHLTKATTDQQHLDVTILSNPSAPDRTACLLGKKGARDFAPLLRERAAELQALGCEVIAMPCNTSHARYNEIASGAPRATFLHMPRETASFVRSIGCTRPLLLATDGTIKSSVFKQSDPEGSLSWIYPEKSLQKNIMLLIYDYLKAGQKAPNWLMAAIARAITASSSDCIVLGCTELSLIDFREIASMPPIIDSLEILAWRCVVACEANAVDLRKRYDGAPQHDEGEVK